MKGSFMYILYIPKWMKWVYMYLAVGRDREFTLTVNNLIGLFTYCRNYLSMFTLYCIFWEYHLESIK